MASAALAAAGGPVGLGITAGLDIFSTGLGLLAGHKTRLTDATNENAAANNARQQYDADVTTLQTALKNGTITVSQGITYIENTDKQIEAYLQSQVGKAGTSWQGWTPGQKNGGCNKSCTVGCCVYYNGIQPATANIVAALTQIQQSGGSATAKIPGLSSSKYGFTARPEYSVTFTAPAAAALTSILTSVEGSLGLSSAGSSLGLSGTSAGSSKLFLYGLFAVAAVAALIIAVRR